jgi:hypothetical protein
VKIEGRCKVCSRDFPIDVLIASPESKGRCPFCGELMDPRYESLFVREMERVELTGTAFERALERAGSFGPNFEIDPESILTPIRQALERRTQRLAAATP